MTQSIGCRALNRHNIAHKVGAPFYDPPFTTPPAGIARPLPNPREHSMTTLFRPICLIQHLLKDPQNTIISIKTPVAKWCQNKIKLLLNWFDNSSELVFIDMIWRYRPLPRPSKPHYKRLQEGKQAIGAAWVNTFKGAAIAAESRLSRITERGISAGRQSPHRHR